MLVQPSKLDEHAVACLRMTKQCEQLALLICIPGGRRSFHEVSELRDTDERWRGHREPLRREDRLGHSSAENLPGRRAPDRAREPSSTAQMGGASGRIGVVVP
jgi:hypothetical protein